MSAPIHSQIRVVLLRRALGRDSVPEIRQRRFFRGAGVRQVLQPRPADVGDGEVRPELLDDQQPEQRVRDVVIHRNAVHLPARVRLARADLVSLLEGRRDAPPVIHRRERLAVLPGQVLHLLDGPALDGRAERAAGHPGQQRALEFLAIGFPVEPAPEPARAGRAEAADELQVVRLAPRERRVRPKALEFCERRLQSRFRLGEDRRNAAGAVLVLEFRIARDGVGQPVEIRHFRISHFALPAEERLFGRRRTMIRDLRAQGKRRISAG